MLHASTKRPALWQPLPPSPRTKCVCVCVCVVSHHPPPSSHVPVVCSWLLLRLALSVCLSLSLSVFLCLSTHTHTLARTHGHTWKHTYARLTPSLAVPQYQVPITISSTNEALSAKNPILRVKVRGLARVCTCLCRHGPSPPPHTHTHTHPHPYTRTHPHAHAGDECSGCVAWPACCHGPVHQGSLVRQQQGLHRLGQGQVRVVARNINPTGTRES